MSSRQAKVEGIRVGSNDIPPLTIMPRALGGQTFLYSKLTRILSSEVENRGFWLRSLFLRA